MKNKLAFLLAGLLAISTAAFAADGRDHGYRGGDDRGGDHHEYYRGGDHDDHYRGGYRDYGYRGGGGGVYLGTPGYYSGYVAPAPYVDPYAYSTPDPYAYGYAAPYADEYVGPAPFPGAIWIGGGWGYGPHGRYFVRGHWGRR
jgi:hypothetical protein